MLLKVIIGIIKLVAVLYRLVKDWEITTTKLHQMLIISQTQMLQVFVLERALNVQQRVQLVLDIGRQTIQIRRHFLEKRAQGSVLVPQQVHFIDALQTAHGQVRLSTHHWYILIR